MVYCGYVSISLFMPLMRYRYEQGVESVRLSVYIVFSRLFLSTCLWSVLLPLVWGEWFDLFNAYCVIAALFLSDVIADVMFMSVKENDLSSSHSATSAFVWLILSGIVLAVSLKFSYMSVILCSVYGGSALWLVNRRIKHLQLR